MAKEVKIEVIEVRDVEAAGRKFKAYKTIITAGELKGQVVDLKFRRDAKNVPTERCYLYVDGDQFNVSRKGRYPCVWVNTVNRIEPLKARTNGTDYFTAADDESATSPF